MLFLLILLLGGTGFYIYLDCFYLDSTRDSTRKDVTGKSAVQKNKAIIKGHSMEPCLKGERAEFSCPYCCSLFEAELELDYQDLLISTPLLTCPKCGYRRVPFDKGHRIAGEQVLVSALKSVPQRFDLVAFRNENGQGIVKRVVGLPGEFLEIHHGDLYINGKRPFRSPQNLRDTAVPLGNVHQTIYKNRVVFVNILPYSFENKAQRKKPYYYESPLVSKTEYPTLSRKVDNSYSRTEYVRDFIISLDIMKKAFDEKGLSLIVNRGQEPVLLQWNRKDSILTLSKFKTNKNTMLSPWNWERTDFSLPFQKVQTNRLTQDKGDRDKEPWFSFLIISCDGRIQVYWEGQEVCSLELEQDDLELEKRRGGESSFPPISIPFIYFGLQEEIAHVKIWRDLHYTRWRQESAWSIPDGEYFLLGDNSPISEDSRSWSPSTVPEKKLLHVQTLSSSK